MNQVELKKPVCAVLVLSLSTLFSTLIKRVLTLIIEQLFANPLINSERIITSFLIVSYSADLNPSLPQLPSLHVVIIMNGFFLIKKNS